MARADQALLEELHASRHVLRRRRVRIREHLAPDRTGRDRGAAAARPAGTDAARPQVHESPAEEAGDWPSTTSSSVLPRRPQPVTYTTLIGGRNTLILSGRRGVARPGSDPLHMPGCVLRRGHGRREAAPPDRGGDETGGSQPEGGFAGSEDRANRGAGNGERRYEYACPEAALRVGERPQAESGAEDEPAKAKASASGTSTSRVAGQTAPSSASPTWSGSSQSPIPRARAAVAHATATRCDSFSTEKGRSRRASPRGERA